MLTVLVMNGSNLSARLGEARKAAARLSARELSSLAGLSNSVVTRLENEDRPRPSSHTVCAIARVLGVSVEWLGEGIGPPPTPDAVRAAVAKARAAKAKAEAATQHPTTEAAA